MENHKLRVIKNKRAEKGDNSTQNKTSTLNATKNVRK